jgi:ABC-type sugar transport system substrate-binding protein
VLTAHPDLVGVFAADEASDVGAVRMAHDIGKVKIKVRQFVAPTCSAG